MNFSSFMRKIASTKVNLSLMFSGCYSFKMPDGTKCLTCFVSAESIHRLVRDRPNVAWDFSCSNYYALRIRVEDAIVVVLYEPYDPKGKLAFFKAGKIPPNDPQYMAVGQKGATTIITGPTRRLASSIVEERVSVGIALLLFGSENSGEAKH